MNNEILDRIESYIRGEMNEHEANEFQQELEQNSELAEYYRTLNAFDKKLKKEDRDKTKEKIKQAFNEYLEENYPDKERRVQPGQIRFTPWLAAAAVIIIALTVYFLLITNQKSSPSFLYKKHFAHYDHTIQPRDGNNSISNFYNGMQLYKAGSFKKALNSFLSADAKYRQISSFYIGLCYLNLDKYREAIDYLNEAVTLNGDHKEDAEWYLALAYLADGDIEDSERIVKRIASIPKHYYHEQAKDLLADMAEL